MSEEEELAGSEMHATVSGLVEYLAEDDAHGLLIARDIVQRLGWNDRCPKPEPKVFREPIYDPDEIVGVVPVDYRNRAGK